MSCRRRMSATWAWNTVTPWSSHSPHGADHPAAEEPRQEGSGLGEGMGRQYRGSCALTSPNQ